MVTKPCCRTFLFCWFASPRNTHTYESSLGNKSSIIIIVIIIKISVMGIVLFFFYCWDFYFISLNILKFIFADKRSNSYKIIYRIFGKIRGYNNCKITLLNQTFNNICIINSISGLRGTRTLQIFSKNTFFYTYRRPVGTLQVLNYRHFLN